MTSEETTKHEHVTKSSEHTRVRSSGVSEVVSAEDSAELEHLDAEGEAAADYIEGLLDVADLDGDIDISILNGRVYLSVTGGGEDLDRLAMPDTVQALQDLMRNAVHVKTGRLSRAILDVDGSRDVREAQLRGMVDAAIAQILAGRETVELDPMSSYERKLVHDMVAELGYHSESHGEGRGRRLVVSQK